MKIRTSVWATRLTLAAGALGCSANVASLKLAMRSTVSAERLATVTSRGWREGESCRFWFLEIPFGLPQVDEAIGNALAPVDGIIMRDVTVSSVHPSYVLFGWHCYRVRGEVLG